MRNLINLRQLSWRVGVDETSGLPITGAAWDTTNDDLLCVLGPTAYNDLIQVKRFVGFFREISPESPNEPLRPLQGTYLHDIASWNSVCLNPSLECDRVISFNYFAHSSSACLILAGGDIVIVREDAPYDEEKIEIVGTVDAGILAAQWSPDGEVLAIVTCAQTFLLMTRDYENIISIHLSRKDLSVSNHVSVGWGKSETQFKGKRAKSLRDPTIPEKVDEGIPSPFDDAGVTISWRGDGAYIAISSLEEDLRRVIRIYSREGNLESVTEPVDQLEGPLSWRPAGNIIASIQRLDDHLDVVFFERNGLRHGQFDLRLTSDDLVLWGRKVELHWNTDSTVLAVCYLDRIQLWTMGNYHYYLKQEILLTGSLTPEAAFSFIWHPEKPLQFAITTPGSMKILEYAFSTSRGTTLPPNDFGMTAVIDGQTLKITPLRLANVPPPMALIEIPLKHKAVDVAFNPSASKVAVLHRDTISIFNLNLRQGQFQDPVLANFFPLDIDLNDESVQQITFTASSSLAYLQSSATSGSIICSLDCGQSSCSSTKRLFIEPQGILRLFASQGHERLCFETTSGKITQVSSGTQEFQMSDAIATLPSQMPWIEVVNTGGEYVAFSLSRNGSLFANSRLLAKNCTSFLVTPAHLIFTTTLHLLKFIHIRSVEGLEVPPDDPETDERCRSIERGARLVTAMPSSSSLVLQTPRGNLETIYPRAMVLAGIRRNIVAMNYKSAFLSCRNQKVDMNILHDYAPEQFMANVALFINQVQKPEHIDLFLSNLREEDVTQTMYVETNRQVCNDNNKTTPNPIDSGSPISTVSRKGASKINRICDSFLKALKGLVSTNLQNILTAHVCKSPPALDEGLLAVAKLRESHPQQVEDAVEHLCFLADVNKLYEHALGLYDLELALSIAQRSQKDPREYLPFMHQLQQMKPLEAQFSIDDHLGRFSKALTHLHALGLFEELKEYVTKHLLYKEAMSLYLHEQHRHDEVINLFARYLEGQSNFAEAGQSYEYLQNYVKATECYRAAPGYWRECLFCASCAELPAPQMCSLALSLAEGLYEAKDYFNAATIHVDYTDDTETAARIFCKGYHFSEAMRLVALKNQNSLLSTVIDQGLTECLASSTELLADCKAQLGAQVPRLREIRNKMKEDPLSFFEGTPDTEIPDDVSVAATDASTSASLFTRYTGKNSGTINTTTSRRTSKNRRREERKRAKGKKGTVYEEEYLINSIHRLIERVETTREEVGRLTQGLIRRRMRQRAMAIQNQLAEVVEACRNCVDEVFCKDGKDGVPTYDEVNQLGGMAVPQESILAARRNRIPPVISAFKKMSLLDT